MQHSQVTNCIYTGRDAIRVRACMRIVLGQTTDNGGVATDVVLAPRHGAARSDRFLLATLAPSVDHHIDAWIIHGAAFLVRV